MRFWAYGFFSGQALPKVGVSRIRNDTFSQKIAFRVHETLLFNIGAAGIGQGQPQPCHRLATSLGHRAAQARGQLAQVGVLRRRGSSFCKKMSFGVDEATVSPKHRRLNFQPQEIDVHFA